MMAWDLHKADTVVRSGNIRARRLGIINLLLLMLMLVTVGALGAVSELPEPHPSANGWYRVLAGGSAQAVLAVALLVVTGALATVSAKLYNVLAASKTEVREILNEAVLKSNDTMHRLTEAIDDLRDELRRGK